jgi:hypothetical protein
MGPSSLLRPGFTRRPLFDAKAAGGEARDGLVLAWVMMMAR